jgi:CheY-like chemotaxis protein/HPt (histidine-containing phosphotransfer) domain-containing protein
VKSQAANASIKRIDLRLETPVGARMSVLGDPLRIRQIVANLLSNAVKFTERGSVDVKLDVEPAGAGNVRVVIDVKDTGSGIPSDKLPAIFEKFTQADGSITRKYGGTGLGLAITRSLVDLHGGDLTVESVVGRGSTFRVVLPCETAAAAVAQPEETAPRAELYPRPASARLLLVEDNLVNQKVVLAILRKKGYRIDVAGDGREALEMLDAAHYDLVLMDVQMPVLDGLEATRLIRRDPRFDRLPVIAMTAHAMNGDRERCLQAGMNAYISKPVQPAHLVATIERHLMPDATADPAAVTGQPPSTPLERLLTDRLMQGDSAMMNDMLKLFLQIAPERLDRIETAAGKADMDVLDREVRKIRVAADQLASVSLRDSARRVEQAASKGDFPEVRKELVSLRAAVRELDSLTTG